MNKKRDREERQSITAMMSSGRFEINQSDIYKRTMLGKKREREDSGTGENEDREEIEMKKVKTEEEGELIIDLTVKKEEIEMKKMKTEEEGELIIDLTVKKEEIELEKKEEEEGEKSFYDGPLHMVSGFTDNEEEEEEGLDETGPEFNPEILETKKELKFRPEEFDLSPIATAALLHPQ